MSNQGPSFLENQELQLILFGGKGGSGKTTSAAATALYRAQTNNNKNILAVSTDPAHSLGDSFGVPIGDKITTINSMGNLWGLEINAPKLLEDFKQRHEPAIKKMADRGTYFDQQDIAEFFSLSLPGLDEVMAIIEIANILKSGQHDLIILDTAPTGHTINLLALPEQMEKWIKVFDLMQEKHRYMWRHFTGKKYVKDDADEFIEMMTQDIGRVKSLLSNPKTTEFVPVTIPEPMSIFETERLLAVLKGHKISVKSIIANRVIDEGVDCPFCLSRIREKEKYIKEMEEKFALYNLLKIPLFPGEIRGIGALKEFIEILQGDNGNYHYKVGPPLQIEWQKSPGVRTRIPAPLRKDREFILFGGKGGVGKTSLAAATALWIARAEPSKKVLAFSTDPAHALSDSFGCPIGDKITPIKGEQNLFALEINAAKLLEDFKEEYREDINEIFDRFLTGGIEVTFDREVMTELISLAPPGLDEIMALDKIIELREAREFDLFILDSAATGHLIRFLELPDLIRDWLKTLFKMLLKYKGMVRLTKVAERLLKQSKNLRKIQETLTDPLRSEFIAITIPEAMGVLEMERLLSSLTKLKIPCHHIIINMVIPLTDCSFCSFKRNEQQRYVQAIRNNFAGYMVTEIPLFPHEIKNRERLTALAAVMYGSAEELSKSA